MKYLKLFEAYVDANGELKEFGPDEEVVNEADPFGEEINQVFGNLPRGRLLGMDVGPEHLVIKIRPAPDHIVIPRGLRYPTYMIELWGYMPNFGPLKIGTTPYNGDLDNEGIKRILLNMGYRNIEITDEEGDYSDI